MKLSAALLVLSLAAPLGALEGIQRPAAAQQLTRTELSAAAAVATADKLLQALEKRDAATVFTTLASGVRSNTSVAAIQTRLDSQRLRNGRVIGTNAGYTTTTVDTVITVMYNASTQEYPSTNTYPTLPKMTTPITNATAR